MTENNSHLHNSRSYIVLLVSFILVVSFIVGFAQADLTTQNRYLSEGGLFETLSAFGYIVCIALIWVFWRPAAAVSRWYFTVILALFFCRELDLDKSQFTLGLLKSRQYTSDLVAMPERVVSIMLILLICFVFGLTLFKEARFFLKGLRALKPAQLGVGLAAFLIIGSKSIDGLDRKLAAFHIIISQHTERLAIVTEEIAECGIPIMLAIAI